MIPITGLGGQFSTGGMGSLFHRSLHKPARALMSLLSVALSSLAEKQKSLEQRQHQLNRGFHYVLTLLINIFIILFKTEVAKMAQTNINIRIDQDLKNDFEAVCNDLGLTMTAAFNVYAKTVTRRKAIPFEIAIETDPFYSEENQSALRKAVADYIERRNYHEHELIEV